MVAFGDALSGALRRPTSYHGVWSWITTVDHKRIGILYGVTAFIFFLIAGVEALFMRTQLARPEQDIVSPEVFSQLFTMHALTMIFLAIMPLTAAFFNFMVPLMIGARDVAFPRLNALSYWIFLFGGILLNSGWIFGGSPNTGWFNYANLSEQPFNTGHGVDFYVVGLLVLGTASMAAAFNFIVTILNMRAPGMTMMRMPVFIWMTLVTSFLIILAFPVITVGLIELLFDRQFGTGFFNPALGGDPVLWQHLFWVFGHPEVYILILPAMGIISEILPTFSRKPLFGYRVVVLSGIIIGFMGWGVWSHHMFTVGLGAWSNSVFSIATMAIAIPTGIKIFNWIGTLWGGSINIKTPLLFAVGFVSLFIIGGLSGVMHASAPADAQQQDTYFVVAHIHYVLFGGSIFAIFAGLYYWWPKMTGRMMDDNLGKLHFWAMMIGFNVTFFPMHFLGLQGMPRRIHTFDSAMGWDLWNIVATVGAFFMAASILIFIHNAVRSLKKGEIASSDPWDGRTLEWSIPSPPPIYNFAEIPQVHGLDPHWSNKYGDDGHSAPVPVSGGAEETHTAGHEHADEHGESGHGIHLPGLSYYPVMLAFGLFVAGYGLVFYETLTWAMAIVGLGIGIVAAYLWSFEPAEEDHESDE